MHHQHKDKLHQLLMFICNYQAAFTKESDREQLSSYDGEINSCSNTIREKKKITHLNI